MKTMSRNNASTGRSAMTVLLAMAVAAGGALAIWRPWSKPAPSEVRLRARLDEYVDLRRASNWKAIYSMSDPIEQAKVGLDAFLRFYGGEMTRFLGLDVKEAHMDAERGVATIDVEIEHEVIPERLPAQFRRNLTLEDKDSLKQRGPHKLEWVWRDGDWYMGMDRVVLTGRAREGRPAAPQSNH